MVGVIAQNSNYLAPKKQILIIITSLLSGWPGAVPPAKLNRRRRRIASHGTTGGPGAPGARPDPAAEYRVKTTPRGRARQATVCDK
eukprot:768199-Hanusia_phi.AAC.1